MFNVIKKFRNKHFQLTLNQIEYYEQLRDYLTSLSNFRYLISCKERSPTTNHEHIHIYVQFLRTINLSSNKCYNSHIESCNGTPLQNRDYIKKDGNILDEIGVFDSLLSLRPTIDEIMKLEKSERNKLPLIYYNIVQKINMEEDNQLDTKDTYKKDLIIEYIYGKSEMNKSRYVYDYIEKHYDGKYNEISRKKTYWDIRSNECKIVVYDDFRDEDLPVREFILFIDKRIHNLRIIGGYIRNTFKHIFITSSQSPMDIYSHSKEDKIQWIRRMIIKHFDYDDDKKLYYFQYEDHSEELKFKKVKLENDQEMDTSKRYYLDYTD
jgi:hypothetical protein